MIMIMMMRRKLGTSIAAVLVSFVFQPAPGFGADPTAAPIVAKMAGVTDELHRNEVGKPVQDDQKAIVRDLDELIASLEKKYEKGKGGRKRNDPDRPADESNIMSGTGGIGTLVDPGQSNKDWGKLSPRERDRIIQSMSEGFPPEYRTVLERYYRRLADEKKTTPAADANANANATATPDVKDKPKAKDAGKM